MYLDIYAVTKELPGFLPAHTPHYFRLNGRKSLSRGAIAKQYVWNPPMFRFVKWVALN